MVVFSPAFLFASAPSLQVVASAARPVEPEAEGSSHHSRSKLPQALKVWGRMPCLLACRLVSHVPVCYHAWSCALPVCISCGRSPGMPLSPCMGITGWSRCPCRGLHFSGRCFSGKCEGAQMGRALSCHAMRRLLLTRLPSSAHGRIMMHHSISLPAAPSCASATRPRPRR